MAFRNDLKLYILIISLLFCLFCDKTVRYKNYKKKFVTLIN